MNKIDLVGKRFGNLTILKDSGERSKDGSIKWLCQCDCGNTCVVGTYYLRNGNNPSCGCYKKVKSSIVHKRYNTYDLSGEYGIGYDTNGKEFYFDKEDYDKIKNVCWHINSDGRVSGRYNKKPIRLHKLITNTDDSVIIDHINCDPRDNRKCNLRIANKQTNGINRRHNKNNKLSIKGVCSTSSGKYFARIMIDGKNIYLGSYDTVDEAKKAREDAEVMYFGEFAYRGGE